MTSIRNLISPARVALAIGLLTSAGVFIGALETNFAPGSPAAESIAKAAVAIAGVIKALTLLNKFMEGSQNWDSLLQAGIPKVKGLTVTSPHNTPPVNPAAFTGSIQTPTPAGIVAMTDLGNHPDNTQSAEYVDHEITDDDNLRAFGTTGPLPDDAAERMEGFAPPVIEDPLADNTHSNPRDNREEDEDPPNVSAGVGLASRVKPDNPDDVTEEVNP